MSVLAAILLLALSRAEIIERMKAPVITQCDGLVQVFADCPEDMRREYQMPVGSFAAETVKTLYLGLSVKPVRFPKPGILIHLGSVRTNLNAVVAKVSTNDSRAITRIYLPSPGYADTHRLRIELVKAFFRSVKGEELAGDDQAVDAYRKSDPRLRIIDERNALVRWLFDGVGDDEENLARMRKVIEPGKASRLDVALFASRLYLYPPQYDLRFPCGAVCLSFREAVKRGKDDLAVRTTAFAKAGGLVALGSGRGETMGRAVRAYSDFLLALAGGEKDEKELLDLLDEADAKLNVAFEEARKGEGR